MVEAHQVWQWEDLFALRFALPGVDRAGLARGKSAGRESGIPGAEPELRGGELRGGHSCPELSLQLVWVGRVARLDPVSVEPRGACSVDPPAQAARGHAPLPAMKAWGELRADGLQMEYWVAGLPVREGLLRCLAALRQETAV